ncbi:PHP domain-containing protein [Fusobacterium polymorphum]|uniref:PHP domain-containing protein n=1 Tax=Fusobacterium nucleatum subsp. polymorphum TaxID=76857 RepID=UPI0020C1AD6C|nr:PHP domain-containing protein [Fusobacterium polymorphum]UTI53355.1 PHP domain-containing protein [Fusobacterium polymorphum]
MIIDFHLHTTASDGQYTPSEIVYLAHKLGIEKIAITDHDTLNGLDEAICAASQYSIEVLQGIELGASEHRYLHILGLGLKEKSEQLISMCNKLERSRNERKYRIINYLNEKGIDVSLSDVEKVAGGNIIARPHFAQAMINKGYVNSSKEAFDNYLDTTEFQKIERFKANANECIKAIHSAGGKAFLAHPYQLNFLEKDLDSLIKKLTKSGLDGIECYYPLHTLEQTNFYLQLVQKYKLLVSAGSDFHGEKIKPNIKMGIFVNNSYLDWID